MRTHQTRRRLVLLSLVAAIGTASRPATAGIDKQVQRAFRGQIVVSADPLPEDAEGKQGVRAIKKLALRAVDGEAGADGVKAWTFYYTAFLKTAPKTDELSMDFHTADKKKAYVANKRLQVDRNLTVVTGRVTITEDDGPAAGRTYHVILRARRGNRDIDLARTTLTLK